MIRSYMKFNSSFVVIPLITISILSIGGLLTRNPDTWIWYRSLVLPELTPPSWVFPLAWNIIFVLTTIAGILVWNSFERTTTFWLIIGLFFANAFLNILWSFLFFRQHLIGTALIDAIALEVVTIALAVLIAIKSLAIASLLLPYVIWVAFAIYLNFLILQLN